MIRQDIYLEKYDWHVSVCHVSDSEEVDEAMDLLASIDCKGKPLLDAYDHMRNGNLNTGLTYTSIDKRMSVVIIGAASSEGEYINSLAHEMFHVVAHICGYLGLDMQGEEPCYLMGWLCQSIM